MKIASIDIGSNTVLLLIAEVKNGTVLPVVNEYRMPRISSGLYESGIISEESQKKLFNVLAEYKSIIDKHNCDKTIVNGTQALRIAKNSATIKSEIKSKFGFDLNIIPGNEEAELSFKGAVSSFNGKNKYILIDIGGASTEVVLGSREQFFFRKSFPIGAVTGKEKFLISNPPKENELNNFSKKLDEIFDELQNVNFNNSEIIAVAGTPTTLTALKQNLEEYDESRVEKSILTIDDLTFFISEFKDLTYSEIAKEFAPIITGREDVILVGTIILHKLMTLLGKKKLFVSGRGLRYGAILNK